MTLPKAHENDILLRLLKVLVMRLKPSLSFVLLIIPFFSTSLAFAQSSSSWGWGGHRYINEHAVEYLPESMAFWIEHTQYLRDHAVDPDQDSDPQNYHYIDIDVYPEFFDGTLPHEYDELATLYSVDFIQENGVAPWVIELWTIELRDLIEAGQWDDVWQIAAELGHYVADTHQPLHLTLNYDGEMTGNDGIHSRYETQMINAHLDDIVLIPGEGEYWPNVLDSTFEYIDFIFPYVDDIIDADDLATAIDDNYNNAYYNALWGELEDMTNICMNRAVRDLASVWITAWEDAGSPVPLNIHGSSIPAKIDLKAFPNPASDRVNITLDLVASSQIQIQIFNQLGQEVSTLFSGNYASGHQRFTWENDEIENGVYFIQVTSEGSFRESVRIAIAR